MTRSAAIALPLGMLRMRAFQIWYLSMKLNAVTDRHRRVVVSFRCRKARAIWRTPWFLAASGTMGIVSRCVVVTTDASTKGWGAVCEGRGVNGLWSVTEAASHINVSGQHVLVRTDNTATLAYINHQGGVRSQSLHHWALHSCGQRVTSFPSGQFIFQVTSTT